MNERTPHMKFDTRESPGVPSGCCGGAAHRDHGHAAEQDRNGQQGYGIKPPGERTRTMGAVLRGHRDCAAKSEVVEGRHGCRHSQHQSKNRCRNHRENEPPPRCEGGRSSRGKSARRTGSLRARRFRGAIAMSASPAVTASPGAIARAVANPSIGSDATTIPTATVTTVADTIRIRALRISDSRTASVGARAAEPGPRLREFRMLRALTFTAIALPTMAIRVGIRANSDIVLRKSAFRAEYKKTIDFVSKSPTSQVWGGAEQIAGKWEKRCLAKAIGAFEPRTTILQSVSVLPCSPARRRAALKGRNVAVGVGSATCAGPEEKGCCCGRGMYSWLRIRSV